MLCPKVAKVVVSTPIIELQHNNALIICFSIEKNEDDLWHIELNSVTRYISKKAPLVMKEVKAKLMIINTAEAKNTDYLSIIFLTPYGHITYPILNFNDIDTLNSKIRVYIEAKRTKIYIHCLKETPYIDSLINFPYPIFHGCVTLRQIVEDVRLN